MFKIISRKKYKELLQAQEEVNALQAETERVKGYLNKAYGIKASDNLSRMKTLEERNLLAEEFRKAEDCIDDVYTLLNAISDKCNINALKAAKSRLGVYYSDPKVNAAINLAGRCIPVEREKKEEEKSDG